MVKIRKFQEKDFDILLSLANQAVPFAPEENKVWFEYRKSFDDTKFIRHHYIAEENGEPVAYGCLEQQGEDRKSLRIFLVCHPELLKGEVGNRMFARLLRKAQEISVAQLWTRELETDFPINEFFKAQGFVEKQRFKLSNELPVVVSTLELG